MSGRARSLLPVLGALLLAGPARAALGEAESSVARDGEALGMARQPAAARAGAAVHELSSPTVSVREFLTPAGTVFAVAWSGVTHPDLAVLLGAYHAEYRAAAAGPRTGRGPRHLEAGRVVVETWGHARALHGLAYLPALLPAGVTLDDLR